MAKTLSRILKPSRKALVLVVVALVVCNVIGKILAPNGPTGGLRGFVGDVAMLVFFVLLVYLLIVAVAALVRFASRRGSAAS